jgi:hypothetical protein
MAAPDTSFQPPPLRDESHPGLEAREHPAAALTAEGGDHEGGYLQEIQRLAIDANRADIRATRPARQA